MPPREEVHVVGDVTGDEAHDIDVDLLEAEALEDEDGYADEEEGNVDHDEASCDPDQMTFVAPTGPALKTVTCKALAVAVDGKCPFALSSTTEVRFLRGKKIHLVVCRKEGTKKSHPRVQVNFDFHHIVALKMAVPGDCTLVFDTCLSPDFLWNKTRAGNSGWEKNVQDFTEDSIATSGTRWSIEIPEKTKLLGKIKEMLNSCPRLRTLIADGAFPDEPKDCGESGKEIYDANKKLSMPGNSGLPINLAPVTVTAELLRLDQRPSSKVEFCCFKCGFRFTLATMEENPWAFPHWCAYCVICGNAMNLDTHLKNPVPGFATTSVKSRHLVQHHKCWAPLL